MEEILRKILAQMNKIEYGWVDKYGVIHKKAGKDFFMRNYRLQTIDETLKYRVGTCWEQVELARYLLKKENIECKTYIINYNDDSKIAKHTIAVVNNNKSYYLMESSWNMELRKFNNVQEIFDMFINMFPKMYKINDFDIDKIEIYEYNEPSEQYNFNDFVSFCKKGIKIKL